MAATQWRARRRRVASKAPAAAPSHVIGGAWPVPTTRWIGAARIRAVRARHGDRRASHHRAASVACVTKQDDFSVLDAHARLRDHPAIANI